MAGIFFALVVNWPGMNRRPDKLDLIAGFTVVVIVAIAVVVARHFGRIAPAFCRSGVLPMEPIASGGPRGASLISKIRY